MRQRPGVGALWSAALVALMALAAYNSQPGHDVHALGVVAPIIQKPSARADTGFRPDLAAKATLTLLKRATDARREVLAGLAEPSLALLQTAGFEPGGAWASDPALLMRPAQFKTTVDRLAISMPDTAPAPQELRAPTLKQPSALKMAAPLQRLEQPKRAAKPAATVYFAFGSTEIPPTIAEALTRKIAAKSKGAPVTLEINGHADTVGGESANMRLSAQRAEAVKRLLEPTLRQAAFEILAHGESHLAEKTRDETREVRNRRVEIYLR